MQPQAGGAGEGNIPVSRACGLSPWLRRRRPRRDETGGEYHVRRKDSKAKWQWIEAVVDSGVVDSVARKGKFPRVVQPNAMPRVGRRYKAAHETMIPNKGGQSVAFETPDGHRCGLKIQIAEVEEPLNSVSQLTAAGNEVLFV